MEQTKATLNAIRECLAKNMPPHGKAMLFGSQARGTARADSDWDILVILDKDSLVPSDYDNVTFPLTMLGWELRGYQSDNVFRQGMAEIQNHTIL